MTELGLVVIRGGGDLGTGCAVRMFRAGFRVVILESPHPMAVRRTVALSEAVYEGIADVEGVSGRLVDSPAEARSAVTNGVVPVLVDPEMGSIGELCPDILLDATLSKHNRDMRPGLAPGTTALGPGFEAGVDVDAVIETNRGPDLGRVIWAGTAEANTHQPAPVAGRGADRVLRAPATGPLGTSRSIADRVAAGQLIASVDNTPVTATFDGIVRGLLRNGTLVESGQKIGDVDPRLDPSLCFRVSDKALAVAGGALEAALVLIRRSKQ